MKKAEANGKSVANRIQEAEQIVLPELDMRIAAIQVRGSTVLIQQGWSKEAKALLAGSQLGAPTRAKSIRDPDKEGRGCAHVIPGGTAKMPRIGHPAQAFKRAILTVCPRVGFTMTIARAGIHPIPDYEDKFEIAYKSWRIRDDTGTKNRVQIIYRPEFSEWSATLKFRFNAAEISLAQLVNLVKAAGELIGVGAWRLVGEESTGWAGGWTVSGVQEIR